MRGGYAPCLENKLGPPRTLNEAKVPQWVKHGAPAEPRCSKSVPPPPSSVTLSIPGKLYAVGGYDGASRQCLSTVEQYNPATNEWIYVADMSTRRSGAGT